NQAFADHNSRVIDNDECGATDNGEPPADDDVVINDNVDHDFGALDDDRELTADSDRVSLFDNPRRGGDVGYSAVGYAGTEIQSVLRCIASNELNRLKPDGSVRRHTDLLWGPGVCTRRDDDDVRGDKGRQLYREGPRVGGGYDRHCDSHRS